ncbi:helix-hairpin-helix domain-containing protein [Blastococcus sp. TF02A-26]|uniref:helix-hairpin-helix domain-containing protein n=1 Tax=Blastococcus sp. TF02A-26 TaxID=2250577 RepID=UPI000DE8F7A1|nr:helix-hairpin-helix domain-containing protein [Blastococcus sp. TF02A-26]RBY84317.1 hypothetical protein DQ240_14410 [Blastococcus sp. TF02A-26]
MSSLSPDHDRRRPEQLLADRAWRRRHSRWLLGPILGFGMVTWLSFLYIGRKAKRTDWLVAGVVYAVATAVCFFFTEGTEGPNGEPNEWLGGALVALWGVGVVHALASNRAWLIWRSRNTTPWYEQVVHGSSTGTPASSRVHPAENLGLETADYYAEPPQATPELRPAAPAPLDVNSADPAELLALPGFTVDRVRRVAAARDARSGFISVEEFAEAAGLAPHEHARLRARVVCVPRAAPRRLEGPGSGRVVDF